MLLVALFPFSESNAVDAIVCVREPRPTGGPDAQTVRLHHPDGHRCIVLTGAA